MISDAHEIPDGKSMAVDICIIGAGAAGITLALELRRSGLSIALLEAGGRRSSANSDDPYRGHIADGSLHEPLTEGRRRVWGGSTTAWGGRCVRFDPIDFEHRDYVPHSGWPFSIETMNPFYAGALEYCEAGPDEFDPGQVFPGQSRDLIEGFDGEEIVSTSIERWSPPTDFGRRYWRDLKGAKSIHCFLHANCIGIRLNEAGTSVERVDFASEPGRLFSVRAKFVVVAAGGLETCRLLMASNDVMPSGVGNQNDCLGRYYMAHLAGVSSWAEVNRKERQFHYEFEKDRSGVYCRRRFRLTAKAQRKHGILNGIAKFFRPEIGDPTHGSGLLSATFMAKSWLNSTKKHRQRDWWTLQQRHLGNIMREFPEVIPKMARHSLSRVLAKRRVPTVLPPVSAPRLYLMYQTEQAPNPESRLRLHVERDQFGMPRLEVDIRFSDIDIRTVEKLHELLAEQFERSGAGVLHYDRSLVRRFLPVSAHHLGAARMAENQCEGVVNADCRVHSVHNLFVAGGAVFPTGSHANPTLTLLALTLRLAGYLNTLAKRR